MKAIFQLATVLLLFLFTSGKILAQEEIDSLQAAIRNTSNIEEKLDIYSRLIREYCNHDPEKALEAAEIALPWLLNFLTPLLFLNYLTV